tara:strand:+ start:234 stop:1016 length:783 start_codon:yes stop_codon:yes gene_type:complete
MAEAKENKTQEKQTFQFPTEVIDLPTKGLCYSKESPLSKGTLEIKYMTAKEEDILTSQNLIKKGIVIDKLLDSLIVTPGVTTNDLTIGDKNAVMIAARILAYGAEYSCEVVNPTTGEKLNHTFNLAECEFSEPVEGIDYSNGVFDIELPISKVNIKFKLLTGADEKIMEKDIAGLKKIGQTAEITTRLKRLIVEVNGETSQATINNFVDNMLSRDSLFLRDYVKEVSPDIDLTQEIDIEGETVKVVIPMTVNFFWPNSQS